MYNTEDGDPNYKYVWVFCCDYCGFYDPKGKRLKENPCIDPNKKQLSECPTCGHIS